MTLVKDRLESQGHLRIKQKPQAFHTFWELWQKTEMFSFALEQKTWLNSGQAILGWLSNLIQFNLISHILIELPVWTKNRL